MYVTPDAARTRCLREYDCTNEYHQRPDPKRRNRAHAQDQWRKPIGSHPDAALLRLRLVLSDQYASDETDDDIQQVYRKRRTVLEYYSDSREHGFQAETN